MSDQPATESLFSIEDVCERIASGETMTAIAKSEGTTIWSLRRWIERDPQRSARVIEARQYSARAWDDLAEWEIRQAGDPFELQKARELAQHFRWRASKIAPEYGDKTQVTLSVRPANELTDDELARIAGSSGAIAPSPLAVESA